MIRTYGELNTPGAAGNRAAFIAAQPHGSPYQQQPRGYLDRNMPKYPPGFGPQPQIPAQPQQPGTPVQLELPLALRGLQGPVPMGNAGFFASNQYGQQLPPGYVKTVS
jgi:hypothetical protein